jgi:hypothetical protein
MQQLMRLIIPFSLLTVIPPANILPKGVLADFRLENISVPLPRILNYRIFRNVRPFDSCRGTTVCRGMQVVKQHMV